MTFPDHLTHQRARLALTGKYTRQQINDIQLAWQVYQAALQEVETREESEQIERLELLALMMRATTGQG